MSKKFFYIMSTFLVFLIIFVGYSLSNTKINKKQIAEKEYRNIKIEKNNCSQENQEINIALITDSQYIIPTLVSMYSASVNKCPNSIYNYYIITENTTSVDDQRLNKIKNISPETINIKIIPQKEPDLPFENMQRFLQYKVGMHKIFLPDILSDLDKVIYMDGDTVILKDLRELYNIDVSNVYASVAKDGIYYRFPKEMKELGLDKRGFYFNSGVMLYNLKQQREDNIISKAIEYIKNNEDFYGDQDVLNIIFGNKLKLMSYKYNCISTFFEADNLVFLSKFFEENIPSDTLYIYEKSTIIHYAGNKPWQNNYKPPFLKELWFRYYDKIKELQ